MPFTSRERNTILAALRLWQDFQRQQVPNWPQLNAIATNESRESPMLAPEIDALCERINSV